MRTIAVTTLSALALACGGKDTGPKQPVTVVLDAGAAPVATVSKLPDLRTPPPLELGSPVVERRAHAEWASCRAGVRDRGSDPGKTVSDLASACAAVTKMKAQAPMKGSLSATAAAQSFPLHADKGHCYRVTASAAPGVKSMVVVLKDAAGRSAAEYHQDEVDVVLAPDEAVCFREAQDASVVVSVGGGDGAFAVAVGSD